MHGTRNYENINQTLQHKATSDNGVTSKEKIHNKKVLVEKLNKAEQEMGEKELQYEDGHDL